MTLEIHVLGSEPACAQGVHPSYKLFPSLAASLVGADHQCPTSNKSHSFHLSSVLVLFDIVKFVIIIIIIIKIVPFLIPFFCMCTK